MRIFYDTGWDLTSDLDGPDDWVCCRMKRVGGGGEEAMSVVLIMLMCLGCFRVEGEDSWASDVDDPDVFGFVSGWRGGLQGQ